MIEIEVEYDGFPHGLLSFSYKLFVGKNVSDIASNIIYQLMNLIRFYGEVLELFHLILL